MKNSRHEIDAPPASKAGFLSMGFLRGGLGRGALWSLGILLSGLLVTGILVRYEKSAAEAEARRDFDFVCREIQTRIEGRLDAHAQILRSGAAFLSHDNVVSRKEWREFAERQKIGQKLPGIQGIGFALLIPPSQLALHIQEIRAEGFPDYQVRPEGAREIYSSIIYLEPFSGRNLRAFGYDMFSEPVRRAAMERARDLDEAALSGKVILVQETGQDVQVGTLMYVPVYRSGEPHETVDERRAALFGWVYSPYRMNDLMQGILGSWERTERRRIHLKIFDGMSASPGSLLYDSQHGAASKTVPAGRMTRETAVDSAGREWHLSFSEAGGSGANYSEVWMVLGGGTIISLLLSGLALSLANTQANARRIAERMQNKLLQFEAAVEQSLDGIALADMNGNILFVNKAWADMHGCSVHEHIGRHFGVFHTREQLLMTVNPTNTLLHQSGSYRGEIGHVRKDGSTFTTWMSNVVVLDANRKPYRILAIAHDVTDIKRAEEEIERTLTRLSLATKAAGVGVWDYDIVNNRLAWDDQMFALYGVTRDSFGGAYEAWKARIHPEDVQRGDQETQMAIRGEKDYDTEFRVVRPDGSIRNIRALAIVLRSPAGEPLRLIGTHWDITAQKQAEEALRKSGEEFRVMFETASIGMAQCDPQTGQWVRVNQKMCQITGYSAAEMLEMHVRDITHLEDRQKDSEEFQRVVRGELPSYHLEKRYVCKDGAVAWVNVNMTVIRDASGKPIRTMAAIEEITDRKQTEETLRTEILRRQELEREVTAIAESEQRRIGHDLHDGICQELSGILFVTELIAKRLPEKLPEKQLLAKTAADIRMAILHTRHLSHSLAPVALEKNDLATALAELAADIRRVFGISCTFSCPAPPEISSANTATHLYRIAQESVQNAIRHGKSTSIEITLMPSGAEWSLLIADNGTPPEQENKSGRGLQIMRYRASMFAGTLRIQSRENCGTIITCTFSP